MEQHKSDSEQRGLPLLETTRHDLRYAWRVLGKSPGFTLVAVLTLALGIGASTAIFSVVNGVLLRPLPFEAPERLVMVWGDLYREGLNQMNASAPEFFDYKDAQVFEQLAAYHWQGFNFTGGDQPVRINGAKVTASFFPLLGVPPELGRTFSAEEDQPGAGQAVVISHRLWQQRFGADPNVIGHTVQLDGKPFTLIGVMPKGFEYPSQYINAWTPLAFTADDLKASERGSHGLDVIARLKSGVTVEQAQAEMNLLARRIAEQYKDDYPKGFGLHLVSLHEQTVGDIRPALMVLLGAVGFVLLTACANVANLLLARATTRRREMALRAALGASRGRLVRQLLTESVLLALAGGALGLLLSFWAVKALLAIAPGDIPRFREVGIDSRALLFTLLISVMTGLLFGLAPALQSSLLNLNEALKTGGQSVGDGARGNRLRRLLVVAEVALALTLSIGAGLMIKSFIGLNQVNPGFDAADTLSARIVLTPEKYAEPERKRAFFDQLIERIKALPGVRSSAVVSALPLSGYSNDRGFIIEGRQGMQGAPGDVQPTSDYVVVSTNYFQAMGIPILRGRALQEGDNAGELSVVINESFARKFFASAEALGQRIKLGGRQSPFPWLTIVGVAGDVRHRGLDKGVKPEMYVPYRQARLPAWPVGSMYLVVRGAGQPEALAAAVREQVQAIDPDQPLANIETMSERLGESISERRFSTLLMGVFAGAALLLAVVGLYGVMSYSVTERTREFGIRMALGAQPGDVLRLIIIEGGRVALLGVIAGVLASLMLTRGMASLLYGVSATDPLTFAGVAVLLIVVSLVACYLPARRATRVDPMIALRYE
jgi:putative ABC transport system permease protein